MFTLLAVLSLLLAIWLFGGIVTAWLKGTEYTEAAILITAQPRNALAVRLTVLTLIACWPLIAAMTRLRGYGIKPGDVEAMRDKIPNRFR